MNFKIEQKKDYVLIKVNETKLNTQISTSLRNELLEEKNKGMTNVLLDVEDCLYCDSSGLSAILAINRFCKDNGGLFVLCGLQPTVEKLISISKLDTVLTITDTVDKAEEFFEKHTV